MKKILALLVVLLPGGMYAQKSAVEQLVDLMFDKYLTQRVLQPVVEKILETRGITLPQELVDELCEKMSERLVDEERKQLDRNWFAENFEPSEIQEILAIYQSDLGKKMMQKMPELMNENMFYAQTVFEDLMQGYQEVLIRYKQPDSASSSSSSSSSDDEVEVETGNDTEPINIKVSFSGSVKGLKNFLRAYQD